MDKLELLKREHMKLGALLNDPHPGLSMWVTALSDCISELNAIMSGKRDK